MKSLSPVRRISYDELATSKATMQAKLFCFLAILGVAYGYNFLCGDSQSGGISADLTSQLSIALQSDDHTKLLDLAPFGNIKEVLSKADFSKVTDVKNIPPLQDLAALPPLPNLRHTFEEVRVRLAASLGYAEADLTTAIHDATVKALQAADVVQSVSDLAYTILSTYFEEARSTLEAISASALIGEGLSVSVNAVFVVQESVVIA